MIQSQSIIAAGGKCSSVYPSSSLLVISNLPFCIGSCILSCCVIIRYSIIKCIPKCITKRIPDPNPFSLCIFTPTLQGIEETFPFPDRYLKQGLHHTLHPSLFFTFLCRFFSLVRYHDLSSRGSL